MGEEQMQYLATTILKILGEKFSLHGNMATWICAPMVFSNLQSVAHPE